MEANTFSLHRKKYQRTQSFFANLQSKQEGAVNHLIGLLKRKRQIKQIYNMVAVTDGGPDWSVKGL